MANMDLFVTKPVLKFEKIASVQLGEDPGVWPREILTELYRSTPETSDYTPRVAMLKIDEEQGFGLGVIIIENSTNSALATARPSGNTAKRALIPVVIKNHMMCPLDMLMMKSGKMVPLNGARLREALFRPETFEMITEDYGDTSLYNIFYPPGRSGNDVGSGVGQGIGGGTQGAVTTMQGPGMKMSADASDFALLRSLLPTILAPDVERLAKTAEDTVSAEGVTTNFLLGLGVLAEAEKTATASADPLLDRALATASPDVVQMGHSELHGRYWVKTASRACLHPTVVGMSRAEFLKFAGQEITNKVDTDGTVTVSSVKAQSDEIDLDASKWEIIDKPGIYKVKTVHGKEMTGWVLPNLIDLDGTRVPMAVFTNGAAAMVQEQIAGAHVATAVDLPQMAAKGTGVFYVGGTGGVEATVPLLVQGSEAGMDGGDSFLVKSMTGEESRVRLVPGLRKIVVEKGEFMMPSSAKFLCLDEEKMVALIDSPMAEKSAADNLSKPTIRLFGHDGDGIDLRFNNMPKLASVTPEHVSIDDAVFALCLAGLDAKTAHSKIASASNGHTVMVRAVADVKLANDLIAETRKTASVRSHEVTALRRYLVKEAAALPDVMTVDAVLSLGFINSENVRMYISSIPYLEKCLSKVCELLLGARVGLTEIPEFAAARCARGLDEVIQGLKALALRDTSEGAQTGA
jgi:hypothetical protein